MFDFSILNVLNRLGKIPFFIFLALSLLTTILLFSSNTFLNQLGLLDISDNYKSYLGITFLLSSIIVVIKSIDYLFVSIIKEYIDDYKSLKNIKQLLENCSADEKEYLKKYIEEDKSTFYFPISDGIANGLKLKGILFVSSNIGTHGATFPFNIQPHVKKTLLNHPNIIKA